MKRACLTLAAIFALLAPAAVRAQQPVASALPPLYTFVRALGSPGKAAGQLMNPHGLAFAPNGDLYVADANNNRVSIFPSAGSSSSARVWNVTLSGTPVRSLFFDVAVSASGIVYAADFEGDRVLAAGADGRDAREIGTSGPGKLSAPEGVTVAPDGTLYVSDTEHNRIVFFRPDGTFQGAFGTGGQGTGQLQTPGALAFSADGKTLYIADCNNDRIVACDPDGKNPSILPFRNARTHHPEVPAGILATADGTLLVANSTGNMVQAYGPGGVLRGAFGGKGKADGQFDLLQGLAQGPGGTVYAVDYGNCRVQVFAPAKP